MIARFSAGKVREFISETNYFKFLKQQKLSGQQIFVVRAIFCDIVTAWKKCRHSHFFVNLQVIKKNGTEGTDRDDI